MRIGLALYGELSSVSGGFLYDRMLVDALRAAGDTVEVFPLPWRSWPRGLTMGFDRQHAARILDWNGDILLEDELAHPTLASVNPVLRKERRLRLVSIVHHLRLSEGPPPLLRAVVRRVEHAYLASVDGFLFNSTTTRGVVESLLGRAVPGIVATPGGDRLGPAASESAIAERCRRPGPLRVLFAGNHIPRKGLHTLVRALTLLPRGSWTLTAAGSRTADPAYARHIDRMAVLRGVEEQVSFPGHLDDASLAEAFGNHHVLAVPSTYEGFGIVYLEAMACGVVPLASREGGGAEIVEHGQSGFLVTPGSVREIAAALAGLAADRERLCRMALEARRRFAAFPGWQASMASAVSWLHSFAGQPS
jgi:glycosyltransferase involved in cell wall biosynthesis